MTIQEAIDSTFNDYHKSKKTKEQLIEDLDNLAKFHEAPTKKGSGWWVKALDNFQIVALLKERGI